MRSGRILRIRTASRWTVCATVVAIAASVLTPVPASAATITFPKPVFTDDVEGASVASVAEPGDPASSISVQADGARLPDGGSFILDLVGPEPTQSPIELDGSSAPGLGSDDPVEPAPDATAVPDGPVETPAPAPSPDPVQPEQPVARTWEEIGSTGLAVSAVDPDDSGKRGAADDAVHDSPASIAVTFPTADERKSTGTGGLALTVQRADGGEAAAPVDIRIPVALLENLYGADYLSRVTWSALPDGRGKDSSRMSRASEAVAVPAVVEAESGFVVLSPMVGARPSMIMALSSPSSSSGTGSFAATDLKPSSSWDVSAQTGGFAWTYPMGAPPAAAGPVPSVALSYSSQSVDGETGSTNNQPSVVGDGWALSGSGFIERTYVSCAKDDGASGPVTTSGDLCWKADNATMSFGGHSGAIVRDSSTGAWKLESDDGSRIERLIGTAQGCAPNGTYNTECWKLTTTDGTQYFFGLNQLPGWSAGKALTNSTWTVPVFGNDSGEPCNAGSFAASSCNQAWRWNLDYVVDVHGNAEAFYYHAETNNYSAAGGTAVSYVRGGSLDRIEYGLTSGTVYAANAATGKVVFGYDPYGRCSDVVRTNCSAQPLDGLASTPTTPAKYPDVPYDQNCTGSTCTGMLSPTFWSVAQLNTVTTKVFTAGAYSTVDLWTLGHSFPDPGDGTSAALWLTKVGHTGYAGSSSIAEPDTVFTGVAMQNRVWTIDGLAPLDKYRISSVRLQMGGVVSVNYSAQDCTPSEASTILASPQTNTRRCFPQWWTPTVTPPQPAQLDLFHKYVVTSTVANPVTGGTASDVVETYYDYSGGTPAWRYTTSPFVPAAFRTWSEYAGYDRVEVRVGSPSSPASQQVTQYTFYQGMDGDRAAPAGGTKSVTVTGSTSAVDSRWLAGRTYQTRIVNGVGGATASTTTVVPWVGAVGSDNGYQTSRMVRDASVTVAAPLADGTTRTTATVTTYDAAYGLPLTVSSNNEATATSGCTTTTYAPANTSAWLIGLPQEVHAVGTRCATSASATYPADSVSNLRYAYDGLAVGATPTKGDVTLVQSVDSFSGSTLATAHWVTTGTSQYDSMGRQTQTTDALGRTSVTAYTPAAGAPAGSGPLASFTVTNTAPFSWVATTVVEPTRGSVVSVTDVNGGVTSATYDPLGRTAAVWTIDRPKTAFPSSPNTTYSYVLSTTGASSVATTALAQANYVTAYSLYDGLGRPIQTQSAAEGGGAVVSDTEYDSAGRVRAANAAYWTASVSPSGTLFAPSSGASIPSRNQTVFDGLGRTTASILMSLGTERFRTTYAYAGADRTDVVPPNGGTPTRSTTNSLGQQTSLTQYLAATVDPLATSVTTQYAYDAQGHMASMQDAAGNTWSWIHDPLGRKVQSTDPDTGTSTYTYDLVGNVLTQSDARGTTIANVYDALNRRIRQYENSSSGPLLASWTFDTLAKGQLASSSSYTGSVAGTPGLAYTSTVTSIDSGYRPTATSITIPVGAPAFGGTTYSQQLSYYQDGSPNLLKVPAVAGLPAESIRSTYGSTGRLGGMRSATSIYLSGVAYTPIGQVAQYDRSAATSSSTSFGYDQATGSLMHISETKLTGSTFTSTADRTYERDDAGNITSLATTGVGATNEKQCFGYDKLANLVEAWTPSTAACAAGPVGAALGGPAPYWTSYSVDVVTGNRTGSVTHPAPGSPATISSTYSYPAASGARPHAVSAVVQAVGSGTPTTATYGYDAAGNTTARPGQTLEYDALGRLSKTTAGTVTEKNVYDASGALLLRVDSSAGSTLFLGDTELRVPTGSSVISGTRTYSANGTPIAERTATTGVAGTTLKWLSTDSVSTALMATDAASGTVTRRYLDPFGNPRGASPAWTSNHAYLNAPSSSTTGLTHLGAREYDPALGRFLTVDAVLAPMHPQQNNGYSYSANSPVTFSDPSGNLYGPMKCMGATCGGKNPLTKPPTTSAPPAAPGAPDEGPSESGDAATPAPEIQWWNPTTWNAEIWQNVGAAVTGAAIGIGFAVAIAGATACTIATFGVCGAVILGAAVVGGAAAGLVTYNLSSGPKTTEGRLVATGLGAAGGLVTAGAGVAVSSAVTGIVASRASTAAATAAASTAARAAELQAALPVGSSGRVTMAAGVGEDALGTIRTVIGTSEPGGYLRPGVTLLPGEELAQGAGHAEISVLAYMEQQGIQPFVIGAGRPICAVCAPAIEQSGATPSTVLKVAQ